MFQKYHYYFQVSYNVRKRGDNGGGRFAEYSKPKERKKLVHYWAAVLGGAQLIGPFFYPEVHGKTIMDRVTHLQYVLLN